MFSFIASVRAADAEVTIRRGSIATDLPRLQQLFSKEFSDGALRAGIGVDALRAIYGGIALSPYADAYLAAVGDEVLFLFEVHHAKYYDTPAGLPVKEGDWILDLFITRHPLIENAVYLAALRTCAELFFGQPGVQQLLISQHYSAQYAWIKQLLETASFQIWKEGCLSAGTEIYRLVRGKQ